MKKIDADNAIFKTDEFQKDKSKFYIISLNLKSDTLELYSDEKNYIVCRGRKNWPTWIWTKDDIDQKLVKEIESVMNIYLTDNEKDNFTCKKEFYDLLKKDGYDKLNDDYFEMGTLSCKRTIKPKETIGYMDIPNEKDKNTLIKYWYDASKEMNGVDPISIKQATIDIDNLCDSNQLNIWRDSSGTVVCMASYSKIDKQAKIGHVYTPLEERKKDMRNLIYNMTESLLGEKLQPLLYTDYNYLPSNKAYMNVGYENTGILINFSCSKERV